MLMSEIVRRVEKTVCTPACPQGGIHVPYPAVCGTAMGSGAMLGRGGAITRNRGAGVDRGLDREIDTALFERHVLSPQIVSPAVAQLRLSLQRPEGPLFHSQGRSPWDGENEQVRMEPDVREGSPEVPSRSTRAQRNLFPGHEHPGAPRRAMDSRAYSPPGEERLPPIRSAQPQPFFHPSNLKQNKSKGGT